MLDRDGWRCVKCGKAGMLSVDHIKPLSHGGAAFEMANLQSMCKDCHWAKTASEMGYRQPGPESIAWGKYISDMV